MQLRKNTKKGRDDATSEDVADDKSKKRWPHYLRVHNAEFLNGTFGDGISLNKLMSELESDTFVSTQRNAASGKGNFNPRRSYGQQSAARLSRMGFETLSEWLQVAFEDHGSISDTELDSK